METMQESNDYFSFMINDFDESILFSLSLIQSAIERVTIVLGCLHVCRRFFFTNSLSIGRRRRYL